MIWKPTVGYSVFKINEIEDTTTRTLFYILTS